MGSPEKQTLSDKVSDVRVSNIRPLMPPACVEEMYPLDPVSSAVIEKGRKDIIKVIEVRRKPVRFYRSLASTHGPFSPFPLNEILLN